MEILGKNLTKDSSFLLYAIYSLFYWRILKKTTLYSGFKTPYKKIRETKKRESIYEKHFEEQKKRGKKTGRKLEPEKTQVYAQKPRLKLPFKEFHPRILTGLCLVLNLPYVKEFSFGTEPTLQT
jgi:hypothetical protein